MGLNEVLKKIFAFALIIFTVFFAYDVYSGKLFVSDADGRMNIIAMLSAWIVDYIGKIMTSLVILALGFTIAFFLNKGKTPAGPY